ncbi:hypothetical protein L1049_020519 [Liquidambar formosana]|uniref:RCD1 WWE domain-containing protein n=1 Tax=Liquidambar formosana TaxID=63359 RepID=A0AAP0S7Y8_LIQFO
MEANIAKVLDSSRRVVVDLKRRRAARYATYFRGATRTMDLVGFVRKDLQVKKPAIEVESNGHHFVLEFLHMIRLDLKSGLHQPIAWIDQSGGCFFPENFSSDDDLHHCCQHVCGKDQEILFREPYESHEIKLQLEIDINGAHPSGLKGV